MFNAKVAPLLPVQAETLPSYLPVIHHGYRRREPLNAAAVALPLYEVIRGRRDGHYRRTRPGSKALRREFRLRQDCQVLLVSVGTDDLLEGFWRHHRGEGVLESLADLNLLGVTVPNFSFFDDVPRPHSLWNRSRMLRVAERLTAAGVRVVPHFNASNRTDWEFWENFLRDQPTLTCVAKEFQTGLKRKESGRRAFYALVDLQQKLGRALHPVLIAGACYAGARYAGLLRKHFGQHFTIADSRPFFCTIHRRFADPQEHILRWRRCSSVPGQPLDALLDYNLGLYQTWLAHRIR